MPPIYKSLSCPVRLKLRIFFLKTWKVVDKWSAGHKGKLEFVVPEDKNGWEILMTFDKPCKRLEVRNWLTINGIF